ncbi:MAG: germination protein YpeB [Clostridia bacterium]|nr:germination protein YpeB [Clostridia bacterium]
MKRRRIRIISFITALTLSLTVWGFHERYQKNEYIKSLVLSQQESLILLSTYLNEMNDTLEKALYSSTPPMLSSIAAKLWSESNCAKISLSRLGNAENHLPGTYKYLSQVGDYTLYLSKKASKGSRIGKDEYSMLQTLKAYAQKYADQADYNVSLLEANSFSFGEHDLSFLDTRFETVDFSAASKDSEKTAEDFPTLIYDGPFADNAVNKSSVYLSGKKEISEEAARRKAAALLDSEMGSVTTIGRDDGLIPCYMFSVGDKSVAVTVKGGYYRCLLSSAFPGIKKLDIGEAVERAKYFLDTLGFSGMKDNYYAESDGVATINYVYCDTNGIKYYPDLIKVGVNLDSGEIVSFDATQYLLNHHERDAADLSDIPDNLAQIINERLKVVSTSYAVIPTEGGREVFTVEFYCKRDGGEDVLVYIDPTTGYEENILLLTYSDQGILTR